MPVWVPSMRLEVWASLTTCISMKRSISGTIREKALSSPKARLACASKRVDGGVFPDPLLVDQCGLEAPVLVALVPMPGLKAFELHAGLLFGNPIAHIDFARHRGGD